MTIFEEYDVYSKFDLEKHKKRFPHYLEIVILEDGTIEYCVPSHQLKLIRICEEKFNLSMEEVSALVPKEMYLDVIEWLCIKTGAISVWEGFHMGVCNQIQAEVLTKLANEGLYKGCVRTHPRWFFTGERWRFIDLYLQDDNVVFGFKGKYYFLSNFYSAPVTYRGVSYLNTEAAFHAQKDPSRSEEFSTLNPSEAKKLGRRVRLRSDWETEKDRIMEEINYLKFCQNPELKEKLIATDDMILVEANTWGDKYWGYDEIANTGDNHLGLILMKLRTKFIEEEKKNES